MLLELHLTEGPNIIGLPEGRTLFYVGHSIRESKDPFKWILIEGKKIGTPKSYGLHIGENGPLFEQAEITRFEHTKERTVIYFNLRGKEGILGISNNSPRGDFVYDRFEKPQMQLIESVYNFFGNRSATGMVPEGCEEYYKD